MKKDPVLRRWHGKYDVISPEGEKLSTREVAVGALDEFHARLQIMRTAWQSDLVFPTAIKINEVREIPASGEVF